MYVLLLLLLLLLILRTYCSSYHYYYYYYVLLLLRAREAWHEAQAQPIHTHVWKNYVAAQPPRTRETLCSYARERQLERS